MKNVTLAVDEEILRAAKIYAAAHDTSVSRLVRDYLAELTGLAIPSGDEATTILLRYSQGRLRRREAMEALGLDYGTLLLELSQRRLPLPRVAESDAKAMADNFVQAWKSTS